MNEEYKYIGTKTYRMSSSNPEEAAIKLLPNGFRFLKEGEIIPENYIYFDINFKKWCFNSVNNAVGAPYSKHTHCKLAISIFDELTNNLLIISAEAKRRADDNLKNIASLSVEELANIIFQAIEVGDFCSHVFDKKYDPHTRIQEYTKTIEIKNKRIAELEAKLNLSSDSLPVVYNTIAPYILNK